MISASFFLYPEQIDRRRRNFTENGNGGKQEAVGVMVFIPANKLVPTQQDATVVRHVLPERFPLFVVIQAHAEVEENVGHEEVAHKMGFFGLHEKVILRQHFWAVDHAVDTQNHSPYCVKGGHVIRHPIPFV